MTYLQAEAIVLKGIERNTRRSRSVALATAAQFEFTISQIDAIGYWMPFQGIEATDGLIVRGGKVWRPGPRFEDFESGILDLARLKTSHAASFDVMEYPLFQKSNMAGIRRDYIAGSVEITRRVARSRVAIRPKNKGAA